MASAIDHSEPPLSWKKSFGWLVVAVACFQAAYTSLKYPAAGLLIFGYALGLVRLADQPTVRRAFYFGLAAGFLSYAPQLWFFFKIFNVAAAVLWLVLAFWAGLFAAIVCGGIRRWGRGRAAWLIPIVWTGVEYFRSELYYFKFSWLNIGYALPPEVVALLKFFFKVGMYGDGFFIFCVMAMIFAWRHLKITLIHWVLIGLIVLIYAMTMIPVLIPALHFRPRQPIPVAGVQMEFPPENVIPKILNLALARNTNAHIFVLSEYTLPGPVPDALKDWCRQHSRFLVVGGEDPAGANNYYDTAFVVGTNGEIVFRQGKCIPIQFFQDGLRAPGQSVWESPWGKIGFCVCYDLSYTRVTDELVRQGARLLIVPTMDLEYWGRHEHELHTRVAPVRAAEYGVPIFRVASSGISQAVNWDGTVKAEAPMPGNGAFLAAELELPPRGSLPLDRYLAPVCTGITAVILIMLLVLEWKERHGK
jgi:apolipoprotein N-acyltransferase